jgi:4-carboxymuconolactone decarboxylase
MMDGAERMPPLDPAVMTEAQRKAAQALAAGPRGGVKGPFIALLRSPELMHRLQKVGEYLRFQSALPARISEFLILAVARQWTQQFEWFVHVPLARDAGVKPKTIASLAEGRRPEAMATDEEIAYDFCNELVQTKGVTETTYRRAVQQFGEQGVIDMLGLLGYFTTVSMVMNVARTPPPKDDRVTPLGSLPT